ncbi:MAG: hypothetical protein FJ264_07515 [Planctomycetes bacterium]|nr:hypothetical protein [Planctomycetota bacterium]
MNSPLLLKNRKIKNPLLKSVHTRLDDAVEVIRQKDPAFYKNCHKLFSVLKSPQNVWKMPLEFFTDSGRKLVLFIAVVFHNLVLGPPKGGMLFISPHILGENFFDLFDRLREEKPSLDEIREFCFEWVSEEIEALSIVTTLKLALYSLPLGGGMCGVFLGEPESIKGEIFLKTIELTNAEKKRLAREIGYLLTKEGIMGYDAYSPGPDIGTDGATMDSLADGHFRALTEMEKIKEKDLLEKLKSIRDAEIVWTEGLPYIKTAAEFAKEIRNHDHTKRSIPELGAVTFKTHGGLAGRGEATAFAAVEIANLLVWYNENPKDYLKVRIGRERKNFLTGKTVIIHGFGSIGLNSAQFFSLKGAKIIAVSEYVKKEKKVVSIYNYQGLNIDDLIKHKEKYGSICGFHEANVYADPYHLLKEKADIIFLAAIENQIHAHNAESIQARYVVSATNAGISQEGYRILIKNGKIVARDSIVKSGGIIGSYLEKIQNAQNDQWEREYVFEDVMSRIENVLKNNVIKNLVEKYSIDLSVAGDVVAIKRIISTMEAKSLHLEKKSTKKPIIIGIFDSGQGGIIVAEKLNKMLPDGNIKLLLFTDKANFPFGQKSKEEINTITFRAIHEIDKRCKIVNTSSGFFYWIVGKAPYFIKALLIRMGIISKDIIVCFACNTVDTMVNHKKLQMHFPYIQFIGPVKRTLARIKNLPKDAKIGVIGTAGTIKSGMYEKLIKEAGYNVLVKATPLLAVLSEMLYKKSFDTEEKQKEFYKIARSIIYVNLEEFIKKNNISHICLACTHYDYLKSTLKDLFGELEFISTVETVIEEVQDLIKQLPLQMGERELEFIKRPKKGKDFDRLILEEIISTQNLSSSEKVKLGDIEDQIKTTLQNKLEGITADEIEEIKFFDSNSVKIKFNGKERVVSLFNVN